MLASWLVGCASGRTVDAEPVPLPAGARQARQLVVQVNDALLDVAARSDELGQRGREEKLRAVVLRSFDMAWIARASLGTEWDELSPEQRELWTSTYTDFHVVAMAFNWRSGQGARFEYLGEASAPKSTVLVKTRLDRAGQGADVRRDYRLRRTDAGWRIIDIFTPAYVSMVGMRRSEYLAVLTRTNFDGLIEDMQRRIETRRKN
jgi:phospholipid transport system substrate-binding protein